MWLGHVTQNLSQETPKSNFILNAAPCRTRVRAVHCGELKGAADRAV